MRSIFRALPILALSAALTCADAVTITYVNVGTDDSRVFVGFFNDASGNQTSDLVSDPAAYSRNDTLFGPLPPPGQLANFDAMAYSGAELGTNLNAPLGTGVRSVFAPFNPTFFRAHGETLQATGTYSANAFAHSGNTTSTAPTVWIVHVDPSGAEVAGTPTDVTIDASMAGFVSVAGASVADAAWNVSTTSFGTVINGSSSQTVAGTTNFSDAGTLTFTIPLGSTFELMVDYDLSTSGSGAGADSTSEITASLVEVSAAVQPPIGPLVTVAVLEPLVGGTIGGPITVAGPFKKNRTIPVKFQLFDENRELVSDEVAERLDVRLDVYYYERGADGSPVDLGESPSDIGDSFRYDAEADQFIFNLGTKSSGWLADYTYRIEIVIDGHPVGEAYFSLR